jgi:hypothetical protein
MIGTKKNQLFSDSFSDFQVGENPSTILFRLCKEKINPMLPHPKLKASHEKR